MNDQRTELSGLAKQTISKSERIIKKFKEMVAGSRGVDRGMRSVLRDMRSLLRFSEGKLKTAKETISTLREKINKVLASLQVFKGLIKAAKEKDARLSAGLKEKTAKEILDGITTDIMTGAEWMVTERPKGVTKLCVLSQAFWEASLASPLVSSRQSTGQMLDQS